MRLGPEDMRFTYKEAFETESPEAYETLLLDVMQGDATLYMRADQVEAAWAIVMPVLEHWAATMPDFPNYPAGSWGPEAADELIIADAHRWLLPNFASRDPDEPNIAIKPPATPPTTKRKSAHKNVKSA